MTHAIGDPNLSLDSNAPQLVQSGGGAQPSCAEGKVNAGDGVNVTLVRWMLSLSPPERLATLRRNGNAVARIRAFNEAL